MEWWIHALYALGIVVMAALWRRECGKTSSAEAVLSIETEAKIAAQNNQRAAEQKAIRYKNEAHALNKERDGALSRLHVSEKSRRALKSVATRYRKRIEALEAEIAELRGEQ